MPTQWTSIASASGTSWTNVAKASDPLEVVGGEPIGLLLALTYATTGGGIWSKITKAAGTSWTNVAKPT